MQSYFVGHDGKIHARKLTSEERKERTLYWLWVHAAAVGFFIACCAASGLI